MKIRWKVRQCDRCNADSMKDRDCCRRYGCYSSVLEALAVFRDDGFGVESGRDQDEKGGKVTF